MLESILILEVTTEPIPELTWESQFAPATESGLTPEMELAPESESVLELKYSVSLALTL